MNGSPFGPGREFERISRILAGAPIASTEVLVGPGDDAAVLHPDLVISCDLTVEGVHFQRAWLSDPAIGRRAVGAAVSDLAAMGARLVGVLAAVASPASGVAGEDMMTGVRRRVEELGGCLLGGDLTRSPGPRFIDVVAVGRVTEPLRRGGADPGSELWVTGHLGGAAAAVALWRRGVEPPDPLRRAFAEPTPRLEAAAWLAERADARAAIDLSDGLAGDAAHLGAASGTRIVLKADALPSHPHLPRDMDHVELALHGGEDYEILVAVAPGRIGPEEVGEFRRTFQLPLSQVGFVTEGEGVFLVPTGGGTPEPLQRGGYDHFDPSTEQES